MPRSAPKPEATNSLVVLFDDYSDEACTALRAKLEACGTLWHFAKLKSFQRCLAVFHETAEAQTAMRLLNGTPVQGENNKLRIYYSMHTPLEQAQDNLLNVPEQEKLWLISPPGSPPIDWRQTRELPPNTMHLDHRLEAALQELGLGQFTLNPAHISDDDSVAGDASPDHDIAPLELDSAAQDEPNPLFVISQGGVDDSEPGSSSNSICEPGKDSRKGSACATPTILIQNFDHEDGAAGLQPDQNRSLTDRAPTPGLVSRTYTPTSLPPASFDM
ncbi:hypothetical protein IWW50_000723 [Coemansia erecta]|nr:hypothetical protein GGF43_004758 [Coemansia sp. RSA 2618]KAJ2829656.1 hypothetical protein IWW50_000723 [Coemansia erecta]